MGKQTLQEMIDLREPEADECLTIDKTVTRAFGWQSTIPCKLSVDKMGNELPSTGPLWYEDASGLIQFKLEPMVVV